MNIKERRKWLGFAEMMQPISMECLCVDPPCEDHEEESRRDENDPSCHSQYCPIYLHAYALALGENRETPA
jgi:hypothetical protein